VSTTISAEKIREIFALTKRALSDDGYRVCSGCHQTAKWPKMYVYLPLGSTYLHGPFCVGCLALETQESPDEYDPEVWEVATTKSAEKRIARTNTTEKKIKVRRKAIDLDSLF
jgi:hypothetical protein